MKRIETRRTKKDGFSYNITTITKMICEMGSCRMQFVFALGEQTRSHSIEGKNTGSFFCSVASFFALAQLDFHLAREASSRYSGKKSINFKSVYVYRTRSGFYFIFCEIKYGKTQSVTHTECETSTTNTTNSFHPHILFMFEL